MREFQWNFNQNANLFIQNKAFELFVSNILAICRDPNMLTVVIENMTHDPIRHSDSSADALFSSDLPKWIYETSALTSLHIWANI